MKIQLTNENLTCVDLEKLLGLSVKQIATGPEGIEITVEATEVDITDDHIAVLRDIYGGQTIELVTEGKDDEAITR